MYFATITEMPILQGLIASGIGKCPPLALLLAGPALSLPNMLVKRGVMGTKKTIVSITLIVIIASVCGVVYGAMLYGFYYLFYKNKGHLYRRDAHIRTLI